MEPAEVEIPRSSANARGLKAVVILLGVLIVVCTVLLIVGLIRSATGRGSSSTAETFLLAPGAHIVSMETEPGRLILRLKTPSGDEVDIIDTQSGHLVSQIKSQAPTPPTR